MKIKPLLISLVALATYPFYSNASSLDVAPMIMNGESVSIQDVPWQSKVIAKLNDGRFGLCGGTIISDSVMITAAHCVELKDSSSFDEIYVSFQNKNSLTTETVKIDPSNVKMHDSWTGNLNGASDIAIIYDPLSGFHEAKKIKIADDYEFTDMFNEFSNNYVANQDNEPSLLASGYGYDENDNFNKLNKVMVVGVPESICSFLKEGDSKNQFETICIQSYKFDSNHAICQGDSGGPLVWQNPINSSDNDFGLRLVGVASYVTVDSNDDCIMSDNGFAGYTSINYYKDWINETVEMLSGNQFDYDAIQTSYEFSVNPMYDVEVEIDNGNVDVEINEDGDVNVSAKSGGSMGGFIILMLILIGLTTRRTDLN